MDPITRQRLDLLLEPLRATSRQGLPTASVGIGQLPVGTSVALLAEHQLDALFLDACTNRVELPAALEEALEARRGDTLARYLLQAAARDRALAALSDAGLPALVFKGHHLGPALYGDPLLRPAADVDLLVGPDHREPATWALHRAGFTPRFDAATVSHEASFEVPGVSVDVHWAPFRPGRARPGFAEALLAERTTFDGLPVPSDAGTLALLLVHPAITKHVTFGLVRALDVDRWVRSREVPWTEVVSSIDDAGLGAAAWVMAIWTKDWFDTPFPEDVLDALAPGGVRRVWLKGWLALDPAERYRRLPNLVRGGFSLFLSDTPTDMGRALVSQVRARREGAALVRRLEAVIAAP